MPEYTLQHFLQQRLPATPGLRGLVVALSGGLDSSVLLHALQRVAAEFSLPLRAVHVHHGLSANADAWAVQVERFCSERGVPLEIRRVRVQPGASLEGAARTARYEAFAEALQPGEVLLMAQHRDDQAETLLFRLLRGAGVTGLGAMRESRPLLLASGEKVLLWRPFLGLPRRQLHDYAQAQGLQWIEDEANADPRHARNFLRAEILPRLQQRWPAVSETFAATALRLQEADALLQELAAEIARDCIDAERHLLLPAFAALTPARQRLLLRFWLQHTGFRLPAEPLLEEIRNVSVTAREDAMPLIAWSGCQVRRYRDRLYVLTPLPELPSEWEAQWNGAAPLELPDGRWLVAEGAAEAKPWRVCFRRGGERFRPDPQRPERELKTLLQECGVPPWERERLPLVFEGDALIAVAGLELPGAKTRWKFTLQLPESPSSP